MCFLSMESSGCKKKDKDTQDTKGYPGQETMRIKVFVLDRPLVSCVSLSFVFIIKNFIMALGN